MRSLIHERAQVGTLMRPPARPGQGFCTYNSNIMTNDDATRSTWLRFADVYVSRVCFDGSSDQQGGYDGSPLDAKATNKTSTEVVSYT